MGRILVVGVCLGLLFSSSQPVRAGLPVEEYNLNPTGSTYEINADESGGLWISDYAASPGEIIHVNAADGSRTVYSITWNDSVSGLRNGSPSDARGFQNYFVWSDNVEEVVGRATNPEGAFTIWSVDSLTGIDDPVSFYSTIVDASGSIWALDTGNPRVVRVTPNASDSSASICMFNFGTPNLTDQNYYMAYQSGFLWIGDNFSKQILRISIADNTTKSWLTPADAILFDVKVDSQGDVWFTNYSEPKVYQLDPDTDVLTTFPLPAHLFPFMIPMYLTFTGNQVWLTGDSPASVAAFNPTRAPSIQTTLDTATGNLQSCTPDIVSPVAIGTFIQSTSKDPSTANDFPLYGLANGWQIYKIAKDDSCTYSWPFGIASQGGKLWVLDNGCHKLISFTPPGDINPEFVYLPLVQR